MEKRAAPFWQTRPLAALAIGLGIGARWGIEWQIPPAALGIIGGMILLLAAAFVRSRRLFLCLWLAVALGGLCWGSSCAHPRRPPEGEYRITLTVDGDVRLREDRQVSCYARDVTLNGQPVGGAYWSFYLSHDEPLQPMDDGDRVTFTGRMYHPGGQENPYGFDFERYLLGKGCCVGVYGRENIVVERRDPLTAYRLREDLAAYLERLMPGQSGLAKALLLGDRYDLAEDDREAFQILGIAHVLAVSGLHVGILFAIVRGLTRRCSLGLRSILTAAAVVAYGWLAGGSPSIIRASVLCLAGLLGRYLWRGSDGLTSLSLAFILLVAADPTHLINYGFIMSFSAVLGILLLRPPIENRLTFLPKWLRSSLALSLSAQLGVAVPVMACYQEMALLGLWLNLLVIPVTAALMALYLLVFALGWSPLGIWLGQGAAWVTGLYLEGIHGLAQLPFASVATGTPGWTVWMGVFLWLVCASRYVVWKRRYRLLAAAAGLALCLMGWPPREMPPTCIQFSLGQADSAIVMEGRQTLMIDTGESGSEMADYLAAVNRDIDALFISHLHMDHVGGVEDLIAEGIAIDACYLSAAARDANVSAKALELLDRLAGLGVPIIELNAGETLCFGETEVQVLAPAAGSDQVRDPNDTSLCLLIDLAGARILTMGDMPCGDMPVEGVRAEVLKVSHHGGAKAADAAFLAAVKPQIALITCAEGKNLPHEDTLQHLEAAGADVYRTDEQGAITLTVTPEGITVESFLNQGAAYEPYTILSGR